MKITLKRNDDKSITQITLLFVAEHENRLTEYGKKQFASGTPRSECNAYRVDTGRVIPAAHVSRWEETGGGMMESYGLGQYVTLAAAQDKKLFSTLQKLSATVDIAALAALAETEPTTINESKQIY